MKKLENERRPTQNSSWARGFLVRGKGMRKVLREILYNDKATTWNLIEMSRLLRKKLKSNRKGAYGWK